jgi:hypothetical protein
MTTQPTPSEACASHHAEATVSLHTYDVTVHRTDYLWTTVRVRASSEEDAERQAEAIAEQLSRASWDVADSDLYAYACEAVSDPASNQQDAKGGQAHE